MILWRIPQSFIGKATLSKMDSSRAKFWMLLSLGYFFFMAMIYFLNIPLRSQTFHTHYDLSGERIIRKDEVAARKVAEKYLKVSVSKEEFSDPEATKVLTDVFKRADTNADGKLELSEVSSWVVKKVKQHISLAIRENFFIFSAVDQKPRNGEVSWEEYVEYFLKSQGYDAKFIKDHLTSLKGLPREIKEALMRDKAAYTEAARGDPSRLTIDEFLAFRHPESSHASILSIVEETISKLDMNEDGLLTEEEFSDPTMNEVPDYLTEDQFREERLREFRENVDKNKDGTVDRVELLKYVDPRNIHHAEKEAVGLVSLGDINEDGVLTLPEMLMQKQAYMNSKMVDVAKSFHDEF